MSEPTSFPNVSSVQPSDVANLPSSSFSKKQPTGLVGFITNLQSGGKLPRQLNPKMALGLGVALLLVVGVVVATSLAGLNQDVRQQASGGTYGDNHPCTSNDQCIDGYICAATPYGRFCKKDTVVAGGGCGDNVCANGENLVSCPQDCPVSDPSTPPNSLAIGSPCNETASCQQGLFCSAGICQELNADPNMTTICQETIGFEVYNRKLKECGIGNHPTLAWSESACQCLPKDDPIISEGLREDGEACRNDSQCYNGSRCINFVCGKPQVGVANSNQPDSCIPGSCVNGTYCGMGGYLTNPVVRCNTGAFCRASDGNVVADNACYRGERCLDGQLWVGNGCQSSTADDFIDPNDPNDQRYVCISTNLINGRVVCPTAASANVSSISADEVAGCYGYVGQTVAEAVANCNASVNSSTGPNEAGYCASFRESLPGSQKCQIDAGRSTRSSCISEGSIGYFGTTEGEAIANCNRANGQTVAVGPVVSQVEVTSTVPEESVNQLGVCVELIGNDCVYRGDGFTPDGCAAGRWRQGSGQAAIDAATADCEEMLGSVQETSNDSESGASTNNSFPAVIANTFSSITTAITSGLQQAWNNLFGQP